MTVTGERVAAFLGRADDSTLIALAEQHLEIVTAMAQGYTRGRGFESGEPADDLEAVIVTATARLLANPEQIPNDVTAGSFSKRTYAGFKGWSLAETFILNRYRQRSR